MIGNLPWLEFIPRRDAAAPVINSCEFTQIEDIAR